MIDLIPFIIGIFVIIVSVRWASSSYRGLFPVVIYLGLMVLFSVVRHRLCPSAESWVCWWG